MKQNNSRQIAILSLIAIILMVVIIFLQFGFIKESYDENFIRELKKLEPGNGFVINIWIEDFERINRLRENNIKYLIVDVGDTAKNGMLKTPQIEIEYFLDFIMEYENKNNYDFILLPYSEINTYKYDFTSAEFKKNFIQEYLFLVEKGFDGIFVDIEPIQFDQRNDYLLLLEELNEAFDKEVILSAYAGHFDAQNSNTNDWGWDLDFYQKVANRIDLISVPGYDSSSVTKEEYISYVKNQVRGYSQAENVHILFGIPTHKQFPETLENAL